MKQVKCGLAASKSICGFAAALVFCLFWLCSGSVARAQDVSLNGGGASFPAPLYAKWFKDYSRQHPGVHINYQPFGSGAGVSHFIAERLDFAGSDLPLTPEEVGRVKRGVVQVPMTAGAVVLVFNLDGVKELRLSREAYAGIFAGTVRHWRDPLITRQNRGVELPDREITLVVRQDSSGTTHILTQHLSAVQPTLGGMLGISKKPVWPEPIRQEGRLVKASGNGGVAQTVKVLPGAIGYVEFSYAYVTGITMATLENRSGQFVAPATHAFVETVAATDFFSGDQTAIDPMGQTAYPILSLTWLLIYKTYDDPGKWREIRSLLDYCLDQGQRFSVRAGYIPIVDPLLGEAQGKLALIRRE